MTDLANVVAPLVRYLAHSLWQGPVLLLAYLAARRWLVGVRAEPRCRAATTGIVLLALLPALTAAAAWLAAGSTPASSGPGPLAAGPMPVPGELLRLFQLHMTDDLARSLALAWCAGMFLSLGHLLAGVRRINRLLARAGRPVAPPGMAALAARAGLSSTPEVREWSGATAPFVAGWRHPVVVLPTGLQQLLTSGELEAVLLHELAHVRRGDVRTNLWLRMLAAFAWHQLPLWKLMQDLGREREHCCDELAVSAMGRTLPLARALLTLEERRSGQPRLAMAGTGGDFAGRIRRIVSGSGAPSGPGIRQRAAFAITGLLAVAGSTMVVAVSAEGEFAAWASGVHALIQASDPAGPFTVELVGGQLVSATIDGVAIPAERIVQRGQQVSLLDPAGRSELTLEVRAPGTIHWSARPPRSP